jgi:Periplasmic protease
LTILSNEGIQIITLRRDNIPVKSVQVAVMLTDDIGYIAISLFNDKTHKEFVEALTTLREKGLRKLIIDVRDNPGGYMESVIKIADELIGGNELLLTINGKNRKDNIRSTEDGLFEKGEVCILMNEFSASAIEILAGIIQDLDRGNVIGRRSYGKGLVQEQFYLSNGAAIRITTARYYLPSGRNIQKSYQNGKEAYRRDIWRRYLSNDSLDTEQDIDSTTVFLTKKKRPVYAHSGIKPDIFVKNNLSFIQTLNQQVPLQKILQYEAFNIIHSNSLTDSLLDEKQVLSSPFIDGIVRSRLEDVIMRFLQPKRISISSSDREIVTTSIKEYLIKYQLSLAAYTKAKSISDSYIQTALRQWRTK